MDVPRIFLPGDKMSDDQRLIDTIEEVQDKVNAIDKRLELLQVQLEPMVHMMKGNGKPPLTVRLHSAEERLNVLERTGVWVARLAITSLVSVAGTILWFLISRNTA